MVEETKQQSNPFSTGGGGVNFETRVQAAFTVLMLTGGPAPCLSPYPITKIKLQGRYAGFNTDDFIAFAEHSQTGKGAKLLAQIKHDVGVTEGNSVFAEVIKSAWDDFNSETFDASTDALALITGPLSATDINNVRPLLEWARQSETEEEFLTKVSTAYFGSDPKRKKLEVFKTHLKSANGGSDVTDKQLWAFLKVFHLVGYDLDTESGGTLSLLHSLLTQSSKEPPHLLWSRIVDAVQTANQNAGTVTLETMPHDVRAAFDTTTSFTWSKDVKKLQEHGDIILDNIRTKVGNIHIKRSDLLARLCDLAESSNFVFVSGERGSGKSSLIREFSEHLGDKAPFFCLRTEDLDKPHLDTVFSAMGLSGSLNNLEAGFALMPKKYLLIESFEKLLELKHTTAFTDLLQFIGRQQGWTVVATGREYAYQTIAFHFLQPSGIKFETLKLEGFSDDQLHQLQEKLPSFQKIMGNPNLVSLLKTPFYADLAFRVLETGTEFSAQDGEREFREAVWRDVIAKEQERVDGMPLRRRQAFVDIAVNRAKRMVYGVREKDYDEEAVLKLEADHLLSRDLKHGLVSPAHDMLEDWAIEFYIEDAYQQHQDDTQRFLDAIGHEPAMNRAFRLWLNQKLKLGENVDDFVRSVLTSQRVQRYWQDETMAAILQGDNPGTFLESLREQLFANDAELLKRFCFILRIACQTPIQPNMSNAGNEKGLLAPLFLEPYGKGWEAVIKFLLENKERLVTGLRSHITELLHEWASVLRLSQPLPPLCCEVGLLALYLLEGLKDSYRDDTDRDKLLSIILRTVSAIRNEFVALLEADVLIRQTQEQERRPHYADTLCEMAFSDVECMFLSKFEPDLLIRLADFEWFYIDTEEDDEFGYSSRIDVAECFGLHEHKYEFFPASGSKGPFETLLWHHPRKALDFILRVLNTCANKYAHSDLDAEREAGYLRIDYPEPLIPKVGIQLNDGTTIKQYCSGRLWLAYRGHSVVPYLLQCALMALENCLINYAETLETDTLEWAFDYILRNSNSVMSTAVLASVAVGFPTKVGKAALPLLRAYELYFLDSDRRIHEMGGSEANWFGLGTDSLSEMYTQERRTAALRPWRQENLEALITRFQFSELRDDALAAIDMVRASAPDHQSIRFLLHRIDSRGWEPMAGPEENTIMFKPKHVEPDLEKIQRETRADLEQTNRFIVLSLWAKNIYSFTKLEREYYPTWQDALVEAKTLLELLKTETVSQLAKMHYGSIVIAAAVFIRDHSSEMSDADLEWCMELLSEAVMMNADSDNSQAIVDITDHTGAAAAASVLPFLLDFATSDEERLVVKRLIATGLTHVNEHVRHSTADGIRNYLWRRDPQFAQNCIVSSLEFARLEKVNLQERRHIPFTEDDEKPSKLNELQAEEDKFRDQLARGEVLNRPEPLSLETYSSDHLLSPCLMIPDGSLEPSHVELLSQMLGVFFQAEQEKDKQSSSKRRRDNQEINYKIRLAFIRRFAMYLLHLSEANFQPYVEQLKLGCDVAPSFIESLLLKISVESEKADTKQAYWQLWGKLAPKVQEVAIEIAQTNSSYRRHDERHTLIRGMLYVNTPWQKIDYENQDKHIALGKDLILEFVTNAGKNPDVFEALARLMYHFPKLFFQEGIHILARHQKAELGTRLFTGTNTTFCLEQSIGRFLQIDHTGPLSRKMHESCLVLLNAIVETASSRAYYLREHLVRSRKIL